MDLVGTPLRPSGRRGSELRLVGEPRFPADCDVLEIAGDWLTAGRAGVTYYYRIERVERVEFRP